MTTPMHSTQALNLTVRHVTLGLLATVSLLSACGKRTDSATADANQAVRELGAENIAIATTDSIVGGPLLTGSLVPAREARIRAEVAGRMISISVDAGQRVAQGETLGKIDDTAILDDVLSARSAKTSAELSATQAQRELERARTLVKAGAIAERDVEAAERAALQAVSALEDAKARLMAREKALANTTLRAPFAGVVSERVVNAGDVVTPGAALFTVVDPASLRLEASVPAMAAQQVKVGAPVELAVTGFPTQRFNARVTQVNPVADAVTRQVRIIATLTDGRGLLMGGLFAEGRVAAESHVGVVVPDVAVDQRGISPYATRLKNGVVERVDVTIGVRDVARERIELLSGISAGDTLLLGAAKAISVGTPVRVNEPRDTPRP
jgi:RND family efflux transporter MFP subunit